jgi:hypothetical protein
MEFSPVGVRDIDPHQTVDDVLSLGGSAQAGVALRIFRNGRSGTPRPSPAGVAAPPAVTGRSAYSADDLDCVAAELNDRPRKRLGFKKPIEQIGPPYCCANRQNPPTLGGGRLVILARPR